MSTKTVDQNARPELKRFKLVLKSTRVSRGRANRDPMGVKVWPTGITTTNVAGAEVLDSLARAEGLDEKSYSVVLGGDTDAGQVAVIVVDPDTTGATAVRRDPDKKTMTLYMADLFEDSPELRPPTPRWCKMDKKPDGAGGHFVLIHLNQGLERRTVKRSPANATQPAPQQ